MARSKADKKAYLKAYYLANKEKALARAAKWVKENPEKSKAAKKRYSDKHKKPPRVLLAEEEKTERKRLRRRRNYVAKRAENIAGAKQWAIDHPERRAATMKAWRAENKERTRAQRKKWYWDNHEKSKASNRRQNKKNAGARLARKKIWRRENPKRDILLTKRSAWKTKYGLEEDDISAMLVKQQNKCVACADEIIFFTCSVDHIFARAKGGTNDPGNLQLLCVPCNRFKRDHTMEDLIVRAHKIAAAHPRLTLLEGIL